jgi:site-specific recombinase XerD
MYDAWLRDIDDRLAFATAAGLAASSLKIYRRYLRELAGTAAAQALGPWDLTLDDLTRFVGRAHWSAETKKSARTAVRNFYRWAEQTGRAATDPSRLLPPVRVRRGVPRPTPDPVLNEAFARATGPRDRLILMLAAYQGLRRAEIAVVHSDDLGEDLFGPALLVHGKGGKQRCVPLHPVVYEAIIERPHGWLFPGQIDGHLSAHHVGVVGARLLPGRWTLHTLRHRFLSAGYAAERDIRAMQELAGHSSVETTMIYTQIPAGALRRAVLAAGPAAA